jgi:hypothetical protein
MGTDEILCLNGPRNIQMQIAGTLEKRMMR